MFENTKKWMALIALVAMVAGMVSVLADGTVYLPLIRSSKMAAPLEPALLECEGETNPLYVTNNTPAFTAEHLDLDDDPAYYYQLQVDDDPAFGSPLWDSGKTSLMQVASTSRCSEITYGGGAFTAGTTYYWRIKFWDSNDTEGAWSTEEAYFLWGGLTSEEHMRCLSVGETLYVENGYIEGESAVYATARATSTHCARGSGPSNVGQVLSGGTYWVSRTYLILDTSRIPPDAIIKSATLHIRAAEDWSDADFEVLVYRFSWLLPLCSHSEENWDGAYGADAVLEGTIRNTADGWTSGACYELGVDTSGINRGGYTGYVLVSKEDVDNSAPIGNEYVGVAIYDDVGYDPYYLEAVFVLDRSKQQIYGCGHAPTSDTQILYGCGGVAVADEQEIYGDGYADTSDEQEIFGDGYLDTADTQTVYGYGHAEVADTQTIYGSGKTVGTVGIYGYGGTAPPERTWLNVYNTSGALLARIFEWEKLGYALESNKPGALTLSVRKDAEGTSYLVNGNRLEVWRNGEAVWPGIVCRPSRTIGEVGDPSRYVAIYAMHVNWIPYWRRIVPPGGQDYLTRTAKVDDAVKYFVGKCLKPGVATTARAISGFDVERDLTQHGDTKTLAARYQDNLGDLLEKWAAAYDLDWWVEADIPNNTFIFKTRVPRKGADRSSELVFTVGRHTLQNLEQWEDDIDTASVCYVGGPGEGAKQTVRTVYDGSEPTGWDRRETFIAAADAEYTDELDAAGHAWLDSFGSALEGVRFKLNETDNCKWRRHFDLGDLVRAYDAEYSIDKVAEIKAVNVTVGANGVENIELTVGEPQPSKWELLQAGIGPYSSFGDNAAPATPTGLAVATGTAQDNDGHFGAYLRCTWSANAELDLGGYEIKWIVGGQESTKRVPSDQLTEYIFPVVCNSSYSVTVRAVDTSGNASAYCTAKTGTTARDMTAPATPANLTVTAKKKGISIKVDKNSEKDWDGNEIHVSTTNNFTPSASTLVHSGKTTSYTHNTTSYAVHYVKVRAYDTANPPNYSPYTAQGSATPEQIDGSADIPDRNIPDSKVSSISATKITGQIVNAQIANIEYAKITDVEILDADIQSLSVTKLTGDTITGKNLSSTGSIGFVNGPQIYGIGGGLRIEGHVALYKNGLFQNLALGDLEVHNMITMFDTVILYNTLYGPELRNVRIYTPSATILEQFTVNGTVWMSSKKILGLSGGAVYLYNTAIFGGFTGESSRWEGDLNCTGRIIVKGTGISYIYDDLVIYGDLVVSGEKHAAMMTRRGQVLLSAVESPEAWFMDVVKDRPDPLFDEVCEGGRLYVPVFSRQKVSDCPDGWLVLAKRKGYGKMRFGEEVTCGKSS